MGGSMRNRETRLLKLAVIATGLVGSGSLLAAEQAATTAQQAATSADTVSSTMDSTVPGGLFGSVTGISLGQAAVTPSYEVSGAGVASGRPSGGIMTAAARGRALPVTDGLYLYPAVQFGLGYNDNITGTRDNRISSSVYTLRPELVGEVKKAGDRYTVSYHGNYGVYGSSRDDDYYHHEFWAAGDNYYTSRARLGWGVGYVMKTDPRGSTDRSVSTEPDRWHAPVVRALAAYGAKDAIGRIELEGSWMEKRYDNNRSYTNASDVNLGMMSGRFFYRVMPRTSALFELRNTWANYVLGTPNMDNTDTRAYVGATWDATAKTSGTIKAGVARKNFSDGSRKDATMGSWEGSVRWSPLTYSTFDLISSRTPADSTGVGNFTINTGTTLMWSHQWASYIMSRAYLGHVKTTYENDPREDKTLNAGVGLYRDISHNARLGLDYNYTDRSSNQQINEFRRNVIMLSLEAFM